MLIKPEIVQFLQQGVNTCKLIGVEQAILDAEVFSGFNAAKTATIIHHDVPTLPFTQIGFTRISELKNRLDIVSGLENFTSEAIVKPNTDFVLSLFFKAKRTKIEYRCGDASRIPAKRKHNDTFVYKIHFDETSVSMLSKGMSAMGVSDPTVTVLSNSVGTSFELTDNTNDIFSYDFPKNAEVTSGDETVAQFANRYNAKMLLTVLNKSDQDYFEVGHTGLLKINVNGITVYIIPLAK